MKFLFMIACAVAAFFAFQQFKSKGGELKAVEAQRSALHDSGDALTEAQAVEDKGLEQKANSLQGKRMMAGMALVVCAAIVVGILLASYVLPFFAQNVTQALFGGGQIEEPEEDNGIRDAHVLLAQGDYGEAIKAFRRATEMDPTNRMPWVEIANIQRDHLQVPAAAAETLREALEKHEWPLEDAAFLMFRLADVYDKNLGDRATAMAIMQQVIDSFPETRHSANATHKLREWQHQHPG
jgi:tetratricopeptide (TPR) repeat protein